MDAPPQAEPARAARPEGELSAGWQRLVPLLLFFLALAVRLAYLAEIRSEPDFASPLVDAGYHDYWAWGIASGKWELPEGVGVDPEIAHHPYFRPPLPAYWLALIYRVFGHDHLAAHALGALLGSLSCVLVWAIARRLLGRGSALIAGLAAATYWILPYFDNEYREVGLLVFLYAATILTLLRYQERPGGGRAFLAGITLGLASLAKPNVLVVALAVWVWIYWIARRDQPRGRTLRQIGLSALGVGLCVAPVTLRNVIAGKDLVLISSNGGINLYIGNNPEASGVAVDLPRDLPRFHSAFDYPQIVHAVEARTQRTMSPSEVSRWFAGEAWKWATAHPSRALALMARRALAFWSPTEIPSEKDLVAARERSRVLWILPVGFAAVLASALLGLGVALRRGVSRSGLALLGIFIALSYLSYLPFFVTARYRAPLVPFLLILSAEGLAYLLRTARARNWPRLALATASLLALWALQRAGGPVHVRDEAGDLAVRGAQLAAQGQKEEALDLLRRAVEANPKNAMAQSNLGLLLSELGELDQAALHLRRASQLDPGDYRPHQNLGLTLARMGKVPASLVEFQKAQELASLDATLPYQAGAALRRARAIGPARKQLERSLSLDEGLVPARIELALVELAAGRAQVAEAQTRRALEQASPTDPARPRVLHLLGLALLEQGRAAEALAQLERAASLAPTDGAIASALARARQALGK